MNNGFSRISLLLAVAAFGFSSQAVAQKTDIALLRTHLVNFRENVSLASNAIDHAKLQLFPNERLQDLIAFGLVNTLVKSLNLNSFFASRLPGIDTKLKDQLMKQIAAGCGSPGPKPTTDAASMARVRSTVVPDFYNKTLLLIASKEKAVMFGEIHVQTELEAGKIFYFPWLKEPFDVTYKKLPMEVQRLLSEFLLR